MARKKPIELNDIFDSLPIGPKNRNFSVRRAKLVKRRADQDAQSRFLAEQKANRITPEYIQEISAQRLRLRLTQQELAKRLKTNQAVISKLERGEGKNAISFLRRICKELGLKLTITISRPL